jgi:hypothetical protein
MTVPIYQGALLRPLAVLISFGVISLNRAPIAIITGRSLVYGLLVLSLQGCGVTPLTPPYPPSPVIKEVIWDHSSHRQAAPGSDLWPITWADDDNLYTVWGDGGGFGGTDSEGRVTLGVARIAGNPDNLQATNVFGGKNPEAPADFNGKSNGLISIDGVLYLHVIEEGKWLRAKIGRSTDHGKTWTFNSSTGWDFAEPDGAFSDLTFLNFGKDYQGARDGYVYVYSQGKRASMTPDFLTASIAMFRVLKAQLMNRSAYEYFAGLDANNNPRWTKEIAARKPVFSDPNGVGWGVRVEYNPGLKRYLLTTFHAWDGSWGIFDAPKPWGPWTTVAYYNQWLDAEPKFGFSFPAKWLSADGKRLVMVWSGTGKYDTWNTTAGSFLLHDTVGQSPHY